MLNAVITIILGLITNVIFNFLKNFFENVKKHKNEPQNGSFILGLTVTAIITEFISIMCGYVSVGFYHQENKIGFYVCLYISSLCLQQSIYAIYGLYSAAKLFFVNFTRLEEKMSKELSNKITDNCT